MRLFRVFVSAVLTVCLTMALVCPASAASYADIENHWGREAIEKASEMGLFDGVGDGRFAPNNVMSRAMFVAVLSRVAKNIGLETAAKNDCVFPDVPSQAYYAPYVAWANENGLIQGADGKFMPDSPVTREQMCVILDRFFTLVGVEIPQEEDTGTVYVDGDQISSWAKDSVKRISSLKIVQGSSVANGMAFRPLASVTRAEGAAVFVRANPVTESVKPVVPVEPVVPGGAGGAGGAGGSGGSSGAEPAESAQIAGYMSTMLDNYAPGTPAYRQWRDAFPEVQSCMDTLMNCIRDAISRYNNGQELSRDFVLATYESQIRAVHDAYDSFDETRLTQMYNIIVRLEETPHIYAVMDFFGVDY